MRRSVPLSLSVSLAAAALLAGCQSKTVCTPAGTIASGPPPIAWQDIASDPDHIKLRAQRQALLDGIQAARAAGFGAQIDAGGRLFDPDYAQDGAMLKPGAYTCRIISLGSKAAGRPAYVAGPDRHCTVAAGDPLPRFRLLDGPQRFVGRIYPDIASRTIFLGTIMLADEATALHYGRDADRDMAGAIQRIGPARWRMVIPHPAWESTVEVMEITPA